MPSVSDLVYGSKKKTYSRAACRAGTELHAMIHAFLLQGTPGDSSRTAWRQFLRFHKEHSHLRYVALEMPVKLGKASGRIDAVALSAGRKILIDWKNIAVYDPDWGKQLSVYSRILGDVYKQYVVMFHEELSNYVIHEMPFVSVDHLLSERGDPFIKRYKRRRRS